MWGFDMNAAISAHGKRGADGFLILRRPNRDGDHFFSRTGFAKPQGLFNRNFIKGVHCHFHIGKLNT